MEETNFVTGENQSRPEMFQNNDGALLVSDRTRVNMRTMGKWMKFVAILSIIGGVVTIFMGVFSMVSPYGFLSGVGNIIGGVVSIILGSKLFNAGNGFVSASDTNDSIELDGAFEEQKSYFGCMSYLIIALIILIVVIVFLGMVLD